MSKFNNTMPQIIKTQCDSGQKSACLMVLLTTSFFSPLFEGDEETSLRPPPLPRAHGHGLVVEGVDMCSWTVHWRVQLGWLLQGLLYDIFTISVCVGFCPWTILWTMKYLTLHSYLSTLCLKERSILTMSSNGHSNWKNQQIPPRISGNKKVSN